jgi:hypothetical protein
MDFSSKSLLTYLINPGVILKGFQLELHSNGFLLTGKTIHLRDAMKKYLHFSAALQKFFYQTRKSHWSWTNEPRRKLGGPKVIWQ